MRRILTASVLASSALALAPASGSAAGFQYGVSSAEVTSKSALLWAHAPKAGKVTLEVGLDKRFKKRKRIAKVVIAKKSRDLTVQTAVAGLAPNTRYYFFFHEGRKRSVLGTFKTAPAPTAAKTIRFAVTGDADGVRGKDGHNQWNPD